MIVNLLKVLFLYFVYRFIKVMIKGYLKNKLKEAGKKMQDQMERQMRDNPSWQNNHKTSASTSSKKHNVPKTFDAEYKVLEDDK